MHVFQTEQISQFVFWCTVSIGSLVCRPRAVIERHMAASPGLDWDDGDEPLFADSGDDEDPPPLPPPMPPLSQLSQHHHSRSTHIGAGGGGGRGGSGDGEDWDVTGGATTAGLYVKHPFLMLSHLPIIHTVHVYPLMLYCTCTVINFGLNCSIVVDLIIILCYHCSCFLLLQLNQVVSRQGMIKPHPLRRNERQF